MEIDIACVLSFSLKKIKITKN